MFFGQCSIAIGGCKEARCCGTPGGAISMSDWPPELSLPVSWTAFNSTLAACGYKTLQVMSRQEGSITN